MTTDEVLELFRESGALLQGHFILSSGLRSPIFLQKARVFMHPEKAEKLCRALAEKIRAEGFGDVSQIVSPAVGGIIPGYETARHLGVPAIYAERVNGAHAVEFCERQKDFAAVWAWNLTTGEAGVAALRDDGCSGFAANADDVCDDLRAWRHEHQRRCAAVALTPFGEVWRYDGWVLCPEAVACGAF